MEAKKSFKKQQREAKELAIRNKRQRTATEKLYDLAAESGIELALDAIAEPSNVTMDFSPKLRGNVYMYTIPAADNTCWLVMDMISAEVKKLPNDGSIVVKPMCIVDLLARSLPATIQMDYLFEADRWLILETICEEKLFVAQREKTARMKIFADFEQLNCLENARAKMASYQGKTVWSLRCEELTVDGDGKDVITVCYIISYKDSDGCDVVDIVDDNVKAFVLQQRVAARLIYQYADANGFRLYGKPWLARVDDDAVWALYSGKESFVIVNIATAEVSEVAYREVVFDEHASRGQKKENPFFFEVAGQVFSAISWLEFTVVKPEEEME